MKGPTSDAFRPRGKARSLALSGIAVLLLVVSSPAQTGISTTAPDDAVYFQIFHRLALLTKIDRSNFRQHAGLTQAEGASLEAIALQCNRDVAEQDGRAQAVIDKFHAQYPPGIINRSSPPPPAPPELETMWQERKQIILQARDSLRGALGEESFAKFDQFVKQRGPAPSVFPPPAKPPNVTPQRPSLPAPPGR